MKITHYRTVAIIYPHLSLEVKVEDGEKQYYVNMAVNNYGLEELIKANWWAYNKPLDQLTDENLDESIVYEDFTEILEQMLAFWNVNPVFVNNSEWKEWKFAPMDDKLKSIIKRIVALMGGDESSIEQIQEETAGINTIEEVLDYIENHYGAVALYDKSSSEVFSLLNETQKDEIFRMVWFTHIHADALSAMDEDVENDREAIAEAVANKYVYDGRYENNLTYWENIDNLIREVRSNG